MCLWVQSPILHDVREMHPKQILLPYFLKIVSISFFFFSRVPKAYFPSAHSSDSYIFFSFLPPIPSINAFGLGGLQFFCAQKTRLALFSSTSSLFVPWKLTGGEIRIFTVDLFSLFIILISWNHFYVNCSWDCLISAFKKGARYMKWSMSANGCSVHGGKQCTISQRQSSAWLYSLNCPGQAYIYSLALVGTWSH